MGERGGAEGGETVDGMYCLSPIIIIIIKR